jgi:hypothetical protein
MGLDILYGKLGIMGVSDSDSGFCAPRPFRHLFTNLVVNECGTNHLLEAN